MAAVPGPAPVVSQRAFCGINGGCDLLGAVGERGGVQFEGWLDQRDELCDWREELPVDLAYRVGDCQVGQVHRDQVHRLTDDARVEPGQVGAFHADHAGSARSRPRSWPVPASMA